MYDVTVVGAGASGMASAILLARSGLKVLLLEKQLRGGRKILASGNGRCNIANIKFSHKNYYGLNRKILQSVINSCSYEKIRDFFFSLGLDFIVDDTGKAFPKSMQAASVLNCLEAEIKRLKIDAYYGITNLNFSKNFIINFNNKSVKSKKVIIAAGSVAAWQLGGCKDGLEIAKKFSHSITEPVPALVPLESNAKICKYLAGVKVKANVKLIVENREIKSCLGDLLFTKYGVSGLTVLDLSLRASLALKRGKKTAISIDFFYEYGKKELIRYFKSRIDKKRNLPLTIWLGAVLHNKISREILKELNLHEKFEKDLNSKNLKFLTHYLKEYKIEILKPRDFKYAEVAYGGVNSNELDINLQSSKIKGLYFTGEIIDFAGERGGYNFIFAWCSAFRAANAIIKELSP